MKHIVLWLLIVQLSSASTYTLKKVLHAASSNSAMSKALAQERLALEARNQADTATEPYSLFGEGARANPEMDVYGYEYAVGISKNIKLGNTQALEQKATRLTNQAYALDEEQKILNFRQSLKNIYHQHCLDHKNYGSFKRSTLEFEKLYKKKHKAYTYQEISKTELMQLEIEKNRLFAQLEEMKMQKEISKQNLLLLSQVPNPRKVTLSCKDMYPIRESVKLDQPFSLSKEAHEKRTQSTQASLERHSKHFDSVDLSVQYNKELDMDKYTVGFSLPLTFSSKKSEEERVASMHQHSALGFRHEQQLREKNALLTQLKSRLVSHVQMMERLRSNHRDYKKKLLPMIKKSYDLGEMSVIEYLLNTQKSYQLRQEIYHTKKAYYRTLFKLYALSEMKDNK